MRSYLHMSGFAGLPMIRQTTATECGLTCIAMIASYLGVGADLAELRRRYPASLSGETLKNIAAVCESLQLATRAVACRVSELNQLRTPCILHWRFNHFVVLKSAGRRRFAIHDPARGVVIDSYDEVAEAFTGVALEISRASGFRKTPGPPRLKLGGLLPVDADIGQKLIAGIVLALICEALVLASPFYLQAVIDQVLAKGDVPLLDTLATGFALLLLVHVVANAMRQLTFQYVSHVSVFDVTARVLNKMFMLPMIYLRVRDLGDVQHRVQSLRQVQDFIVHSAPALVLDVVFIALITALMSLYDTQLTFLATATALSWGFWRATTFRLRSRLSSDIAISESTVQTHFLESLRAMQTIKMVNGEAARQSEWRDLFARGINLRIRAGNLLVIDNALRQVLFQGLRVATIYVLAKKGLSGDMSIGMVSAFVAYLGMFISRVGGIIDRVTEYRLLEVPLNRLADIVFNDEEVSGRQEPSRSVASWDIDLADVAFRYSSGERWILEGCSCRIPENGFIAIAGVSGTGKTTLLKLIAGVESLSVGEITIGGRPVVNWRPKALRENVATVFQDDRLLKGSVAGNIALFDSVVDMGRVKRSAQKAFIAPEIESLPMSYETRISDLGSSLSKGQTQRILLARAFYREPKVLLMDEVTSGMDLITERRVIDAISDLAVTRVVITHSDQMLQAADQVLWLHKGTLLSSRPELNV